GVPDAGIANDDRLANERLVFDGQESQIYAHRIPGLAKQRRDLIEQPGLHAHEIVLSRLAEFGEKQPLRAEEGRQLALAVAPGRNCGARFTEAEREEAANRKGRSHLQGRRAAHAGPDWNITRDCGIESAEVHTAL